MQQKERGNITIGDVFCGVQIVLAIIWFVLHISYVSENAPADFFLSVLHNNMESDYTGWIYPVFLRFLQNISPAEKGTITGLYVFVCLTQMIALYCGICFFMAKSGLAEYVTKKRLYLCGAVCLAFPPVMQSVATVSPVALAVALLLFFFGVLLQEGEDKWRNIKLVITAFILYLLYIPQYYIALLGWLFLLIKRSIGGKRNCRILLKEWVFFAGAWIALAIPGFLLFQRYEGIYRGAETGFMLGVAYENITEDYYFWPDEIRQMISEEEIVSSGRDRRTVLRLLGEKMDEADVHIGKERHLIFRIGLASVMNRTRDVLALWGKQLLENIAAPISFACNVNGIGMSNTAWRLVDFYGKSWIAGIVHLLWSYGFLFYCAGVQFFARVKALYQGEKVFFLRKEKVAGFVIGTVAFYNALCSPAYFDYLMCIPIFCVYVAVFCFGKKTYN